MRLAAAIRPAQAADIAAIAQVHLEASKIAYRDILDPALLDGLSLDGRIALWERRFAQIGSQGRLWVQCAGAEMIGFALCDLPDDRNVAPSVCELKSFYVTPDCWGVGFGGRLLAYVVADLKSRGFSDMILWTISDNRPARDFYARTGFRCEELSRRTSRSEAGLTLEYEEVLYSRAL